MSDPIFQENTDCLQEKFPTREEFIQRILREYGPPELASPMLDGHDFRHALA